jgi:hydrogenase maturation protein HypF
LQVDGARFERLGHLAPLRLVGNDAESRIPWRLAASVLHALGRGDEIERRFSGQPKAASIAQHLLSGDNSRDSSSLGRLFDAVASILGVKDVSIFNGQATLMLEGMAEQFGEVAPLSGGWAIANGCLDLLPLLSALVDEKDAQRGAALFHSTLAVALAEWLCTVAPQGATVAAGGSCMQNQVLARGLRTCLGDRGLHLIEARRIPPNDGGLSLGQAWVAQQYLQG